MLLKLSLIPLIVTAAPLQAQTPQQPDTTALPPADHDVETSLRGSPESMVRQHAAAIEQGYTFVGTVDEMEALAGGGHLVPVRGGASYEVMDWVFPYALPEVRTFVEHLAGEYRDACGEPLVVTSLTRPLSEQPPNAHQLSVHPAGMAVDLRVSQTAACREFVESRLLELEDSGVVDLTRERSPPHYHVAIFPTAFRQWAAANIPIEQIETAEDAADPALPGRSPAVLLTILVLLVIAGAAYVMRSRRAREP